MENDKTKDLLLDAFKTLVPHSRGALWWVRNDLLKACQSKFNPHDTHIGHPALSLLKVPLQERCDEVPMLTGTSGGSLSWKAKSHCVKVTGMTADEPDHETYFGSIIEPAVYTAADLLDGVIGKNEIHTEKGHLVKDPWHKHRVMVPNRHKAVVNAEERAELDRFCELHNL